MYMEEWWDTTTLDKVFGIGGSRCMLVDMTPIRSRGRKPGFTHSEETKDKMRDAAKGRDITKFLESAWESNRGKPAHNKGEEYPHLRKKGRLIKDGVIYEVDGVMKFSREHNLPPDGAGISRVLNGKRKSYRGFRLA